MGVGSEGAIYCNRDIDWLRIKSGNVLLETHTFMMKQFMISTYTSVHVTDTCKLTVERLLKETVDNTYVWENINVKIKGFSSRHKLYYFLSLQSIAWELYIEFSPAVRATYSIVYGHNVTSYVQAYGYKSPFHGDDDWQ